MHGQFFGRGPPETPFTGSVLSEDHQGDGHGEKEQPEYGRPSGYPAVCAHFPRFGQPEIQLQPKEQADPESDQSVLDEQQDEGQTNGCGEQGFDGHRESERTGHEGVQQMTQDEIAHGNAPHHKKAHGRVSIELKEAGDLVGNGGVGDQAADGIAGRPGCKDEGTGEDDRQRHSDASVADFHDRRLSMGQRTDE